MGMIQKILILFSVVTLAAHCVDINPHDILVEKKICSISSNNTKTSYVSIIKMTCIWNEFRDENNNIIANKQSYRGTRYIYEIIFTKPFVPSEIEKYKIINKGLFSNFRLKSLSFQNLSKLIL